MSTLGGGGGSDFDRLLALAKFVQEPDYHDRVENLRDLIEANTAAELKAVKETTEANDALKQLAGEMEKHKADLEDYNEKAKAFGLRQQLHRADMEAREKAVKDKSDDVARREAVLAKDKTDFANEHQAKTKAHDDREAAIKFGEDKLAQNQAAFAARVARVNRAISDE
jgi:predicted  nucleic acid-binding Zn-ribbon protein